MDCGIPFCHEGCPLGNLIPEWNDLVYRDDWAEAIERLHATNNFPEFTGRLCPAPCEGACVLGHQRRPGHHRAHRVRDRRAGLGRGLGGTGAPGHPDGQAGGRGGLRARPGWPPPSSCVRAGHEVVVYERAERPGGLLRYGIPEFKMEKAVLDRRLAQLEAEGVEFRCGVSVGVAVAGRAPGPRPTDATVAAHGRPGRRRTTPWSWPAGPPCPATCPSRGASSTGSTGPWTT